MRHAAPKPRHPLASPKPIGKQAIVVGAGIGGLAAAGALADWFEHVIVLDRDVLPDEPTPRSGTPQSRHSHGLLLGGLLALEELFPDIQGHLVRAGAVPVRIIRDMREEWPDREPAPQRDFGWISYTMSRALIESTLRRCVSERANVSFRQTTRALALLADARGRRVVGLRCEPMGGGAGETLSADIVVDASGRGELTKTLLQSIGRPLPSETAIGIDLGYTTAVLDIPDGAPSDWKVLLTHAEPPRSSRLAVMLQIEGDRWMMTAAGRGDDRPPGDWTALLDYLRHLSTPTLYNAVRHARPVGELARFGQPESIWRHFERLKAFPDGLIPIGDAICRFNPIYGQGMTVAAKEASLLHRLLGSWATQRDPLAGLGQLFLAEAKSLIETPWMMAAIPDFAFPETRGDRPADLDYSLRFADALSRIAARDAAVQRLMIEVRHMLKPRAVYEEPALRQRVEAEMTEMAAP
jgi:2-polyprenyl-6-methoxyphenol hydroxylase-like FAD-dependent oxidoreductase